MAALHVVTHADALSRCLEVAGPDDSILLIRTATNGLDASAHPRLFVLVDDLATAIAPAEPARNVDYAGFVGLVTEHQPIITWS